MNEEFSAGVKILLQRMETNPEEFFSPEDHRSLRASAKFEGVMEGIVNRKIGNSLPPNSIVPCFSQAELDALFEGYSKIRRKAFDDYVMSQILDPKEGDGVALKNIKHPTKLMTMASITNEALRILENELTFPSPKLSLQNDN